MPEKYQQEIEEILKRVEDATPIDHTTQPEKDPRKLSKPSRANNRPNQSRGAGSQWLYLSPGKIALAGLLILLIGAVWLQVLIWVGLGLLVLAYLLFFVKPGSPAFDKRWRGRAVESRPSAWQRLTRWLKS